MEQAYWLAWSGVKGLGSVLLKRIYQHFGSMETAWRSRESELGAILGIGNQAISAWQAHKRNLDPIEAYQRHLQTNPRLWTPADPQYPQLLWEIADPPPILYWQGSMTQWRESKTVAIVGTRQPSVYGKSWAIKLGKALAEEGFVVVSGLAEGIDGYAHQGCLQGQGQAIAVMATGLEQVYPPTHRELHRQIGEKGLILTEYAHGTQVDKSFFPRRNRIIAGLCRATLVIEAPEKSGALITAHQAIDYGRDVYALPNDIDVKQARGCLELIAKGAGVILGVKELVSALSDMPSLDRKKHEQMYLLSVARSMDAPTSPNQQGNTPPIIADPVHQRIYEQIPDGEYVPLDLLAEKLAMPLAELSANLVFMEIQGLVENNGTMHYRRSMGY
jgi:DNA processing protein